MAEFPALPFWTDAYLGDTMHLTTIEHGAYLLLLFTAWRTPTYDLPDDDKKLARFCRLTDAQWARMKPTIMAYWRLADGRWSNGRLLDERDAVRRKVGQRSDAGKASALKRLNRGATPVQRNPDETPTSKATPTPTPKVVAPPATFEQKIAKITRLGQALGFDPSTARNGHRFIEDLVRLEADGFDFDLDILTTIQERRTAGSVPRDLGSLAYFRKAFEAKRETRKITGAIAEQRAAIPVEETDAAGWDARLKRWLESGWWPPQYGPRPLSGTCMAPTDRVALAKTRWEDQGGHPRGAFPADPNGRFQDWKDLRDLRDDPNVDYGNRALNVVAIPRRTA